MKKIKLFWCHTKFKIQSFGLDRYEWLALYNKYVHKLNKIRYESK